ncbi:hypothetical protein [Natronomonas sp. LN261]|nr:hypothetical protein [Natronomonas sp. LN261]
MSNDTNETRFITVALIVVGVLVLLPMFAMGLGMMGTGPMMG